MQMKGQGKSKSKRGVNMGVSDRIETFIMELLKDEEDWVQIGRNELAAIFNCVPSQINYVISTRFSPERGYMVESRRGGGGCLKIRRISTADDVSYVISLIGNEIDYSDAKALITYLYTRGKIEENMASVILAGISDNSLSAAGDAKNRIRALSLKNMLSNI